MAFTDRYVHIPQIRFYKIDSDRNNESNDIYGDYISVETFIRINPLHILGYCPDKGVEIPENRADFPYTLVHMKDNVSFVALLPIKDFEELIDSFYKKMEK